MTFALQKLQLTSETLCFISQGDNYSQLELNTNLSSFRNGTVFTFMTSNLDEFQIQYLKKYFHLN